MWPVGDDNWVGLLFCPISDECCKGKGSGNGGSTDGRGAMVGWLGCFP